MECAAHLFQTSASQFHLPSPPCEALSTMAAVPPPPYDEPPAYDAPPPYVSPKRSRETTRQQEMLERARRDPALITPQQRLVMQLLIADAETLDELDPALICFECGHFTAVRFMAACGVTVNTGVPYVSRW